MNCLLMHKEIPVIEMKLDRDTSSIMHIGEVFASGPIPLGVLEVTGKINRSRLNEWWRARSIPASRVGLSRLLDALEITSAKTLLDKSYGLSLTDQYWICPESSNLKWEDINFFHHHFSEDIGNILLDKEHKGEKINLLSPDNTSDGWLSKKWSLSGDKRVLIKGGSGATQQEPYNEVFASEICAQLGIPHTPYTLSVQEEYPYSVCENFINADTELISAWYVMQTMKKQNHVSVYAHYVMCCERLGMPNMSDFLDRMIVLDYLIVNEDRHQNNFGVVRHAGTLEFTGASPIFDNGSSLWHDLPTSLIGARTSACKPFKHNHEEQIKLVQSFDWFDPSVLTGIENKFYDITKDSLFIDNARKERICTAFRSRVNMLTKFINMKSKGNTFSGLDTSGDVEIDVKYSGKTEES